MQQNKKNHCNINPDLIQQTNNPLQHHPRSNATKQEKPLQHQPRELFGILAYCNINRDLMQQTKKTIATST
jgi:hypothetical protein